MTRIAPTFTSNAASAMSKSARFSGHHSLANDTQGVLKAEKDTSPKTYKTSCFKAGLQNMGNYFKFRWEVNNLWTDLALSGAVTLLGLAIPFVGPMVGLTWMVISPVYSLISRFITGCRLAKAAQQA